jgi:type IV pilus assembly protein PilC
MRKKEEFLRFFSMALSALLSAGVPLLKSLQILAAQQESAAFKKTLEGVAEKISHGESLSRSMEQYPSYFPGLITGLILIGEKTGTLPQNLQKIAKICEKNLTLKLKMISALTYPLILFGLTILGTILLIKVFVPQFVPVFAQNQGALPYPTRFLLFISNLFSSSFFWIFLLLLLAFSIFLYSLIQDYKINLGAILLFLPFIREIVKKGTACQITSTLSIAYSAGLPLSKALELTADILDHPTFQELIQNARLTLIRGEKLSSFFLENSNLIPSYLGHMMAAAEQTGRVDILMTKCTKILEEDLSYLMDQFSALLEPGILIFMGGIVTFIMLAVFLPMYGILHSI